MNILGLTVTASREVAFAQQPEWLAGFISGVFATLLGFFLTMVWDTFKYNRDKSRKEKTILAAIKYEIEHNLTIANGDISTIKLDIEAIKKNKTVIVPLHSLQSNIWDMIKADFPKILEKDGILPLIQDVSLFTEYANEQIECRETWKIHNQLLSNYNERLTQYSEILIGWLEKLIKQLTKLKTLLG